MNRILRQSLLLALALVILAGFGCAKKEVTDPQGGGQMYDGDEMSLNEKERQAAGRISNGVIYFAYDSFALDGTAQSILTQSAEVIRQFPQLRVTIEGHCDERGTQEYNLALGERRARAAYDYLLNLGISPSQLEMVSFGKLHPAVSGYGESTWSKNRRDEFKVYKPRN